MKRFLLVANTIFLGVAISNGQNYTMSNTGETTCSGTFYDSGGSAGDYSSNELFTKTFTPSVGGNMLQFVFTAFNIETCCDDFTVYDGPTTGSPLIGVFTNNPGTITATNPTGQLTFVWDSDGSVQYSGWAATISCVAPPTTYAMSNAPVTTCSGIFADDGGGASDYTVNDYTQTFSPSTGGMSLQFVFTSWAIGDAQDYLEIYDGANTGAPLIGTFTAASGSPGTVTATNGSGQLTFVWFSDNNGLGAGWTANISCVTPPPVNSNPCGALSLTVNPDYNCGTVTAGTVANATPSALTVSPCFGTPDDDVWFTFVATGTAHRVSLLNVSGSVTDMYHSVYSGACGSLTNISCNDGNTTNLTGLIIGNTYYVRVYTYTATGGQNTTFNVCVGTPPPPPPNDEPCSATSLTVNPDLLCGSVTAGTVSSATNTGIAACIGSGADDDVWFSFVATSTVHNFDLLNITGSSTDMVFEIFSGACGSLGSIACSDPNSGQWGGFTIGQTYYVRVYTYTSTGGQTTTFNLCVGTPPPPPSNDEPCGAITLNVNIGSCAFQSAVLGTASTLSIGMPAPGCSSLGEDVWFKVTVPAGGLIIDLAPSGGPTDMGMAWYTGSSCSNLTTLVECDDDDSQNGAMPMICRTGASCTVPGDCAQNAKLAPGTIVYVRIWEYGGGTFGPFDICAYEPAPAGAASDCASATTIAGLPYSNSGQTTCCRVNSYTSANGCGSSYQDGEDFIYQYTPSTNQQVDITLTGTLSYTGIFITDKCPNAGGVNCVASATSSSGNPTLCAVSLVAGTTYYIMIDTDPSPTCTPFNFNITSSSSPTCGLNYAISNIGYAPDLNAGTNIALPTDDRFSSSYVPIGFEFCFDGYQFTQLLVSSNGYVIFDPISCASNLPGGNAAPGGYSAYSINAAIPNTTNAPRNSILFPWQDIDPSLGGTIRHQILGVMPNRRFVLTFDNIPYYSCTSKKFTGQLKLFETTNNIEVHIGNKEICSWNSNAGILGLHNFNGTVAVLGTNYPTSWTASNLARRFTYNCVGPCIVPLPITLLSFEGQSFERHNLLKWSTASEINNDYFTVEKSRDGLYFEKILTVKGAGNSSSNLNYSAIDDQPYPGINYYRLKQTDFDGKFEYSNIIAVRVENEQTSDIIVMPNPFKDHVEVVFESEFSTETTYSIYDIRGQKIFTKSISTITGHNRVKIDLSEFRKGIYFFSMASEIQNFKKKLVKN